MGAGGPKDESGGTDEQFFVLEPVPELKVAKPSDPPRVPSLFPRRAAEERPLPKRTSIPAIDLSACGTFAGYEILGRLAQGGMAEILLARTDENDNITKYLVVKRIIPHYEANNDFVQMFLDEARIGLRLRHPNICEIYRFGEDKGQHFIAMEWLNGVTLSRVVRRARKHEGISPRIVMRMIASIAGALDYAHRVCDERGAPMNLIHRDVTPHNIMVSFEGESKLLDFGIAKIADKGHQTEAGTLKGKFAYIAPENYAGATVDHRLDIFALGACLFEALTGQPVFKRASQAATLHAIMHDDVPPLEVFLPDAPEALDGIVRKALAKYPDDRFASAGDFARALDECATQYMGGLASAREVREFVHRLFPAEAARGPHFSGGPPDTSTSQELELETSPHKHNSSPEQVLGGPVLELEEREEELRGLLGEVPAAPRSPSVGDFLSLAPPPLSEPPPPDIQASGDKEQSAEEAPAGDEEADDDELEPEVALELDLEPAAAARVARMAEPNEPPTAVATRKHARELKPIPRPSREGLPTMILAVFALTASVSAGVLWVAAELREPSAEELSAADLAPAANPILHGRILVASVPSGANVYLNGRDVGKTPASLTDVLAGEYSVRVSMPAFADFTQDVKVAAGDTQALTARLIGIQGGGSPGSSAPLTVDTDPPTRVYIAGHFLGQTPLEGVPVPTGLVHLTFKTDEGAEFKRKALFQSGKPAKLSFKLK